MRNRICLWIMIFTLIAVTGCQGFLPGSTSSKQPWPTESWQVSTPEEQGMDSAKLADMLAEIQAQNLNVHSLLIIRNGYIVAEAYYPPYHAGIRHTVQSITKSVLGALTGIAIDQGLLKSTDQKLVDFFPEMTIQERDAQKESITLHHLLTMTPGLDCQDQSSAANGMFGAEDWVQYMLDLPVIDPPGTRWIYCSGAPHLISAVLQKQAGMDARSYANQFLFAPLGIAPVEVQDWGTDPKGVSDGVAGLYLTPRELAKFGYLYLNGGAWDGKQIVSKKWVEESTGKQVHMGPDELLGGVDRWWGNMLSVFPEWNYYGYIGRSGQELFVLPEKDLVVVFTAALEEATEPALLKLVNEYIAPSVVSDKPVQAQLEAAARLKEAISAIDSGKQPPAPLPQAALDASGKTYTLEQNPQGWTTLTFTFQPGSDEAILSLADTPDIKIGLDNTYHLTEDSDGRGRPIGLRGAWQGDNTLSLDYLTLGEFLETKAIVVFDGDQISMSISSKYSPGTPVVVRGNLQ